MRCLETVAKSEESIYLFRIDHTNLPNERANVNKEIEILDRLGWINIRGVTEEHVRTI